MDSDEAEDTWTNSPEYEFAVAQNMPHFDKDSSDEEDQRGNRAANGVHGPPAYLPVAKSPFFSPLKEREGFINEKDRGKDRSLSGKQKPGDNDGNEPMFSFDAAEVKKFLKNTVNTEAVDEVDEFASKSEDSAVFVQARPSFVTRSTTKSLEEAHMMSPGATRRPTGFVKNKGDESNSFFSLSHTQRSLCDNKSNSDSPPPRGENGRRSNSPERAATPLTMSSYNSMEVV